MKSLPIVDQPAPPLPQVADPEGETRYSKGTYAFVSLGCPKNLIDSERMLGALSLDGYSLVSEPDGADFVIVNTCGFIESARDESKGVIHEMLDLKRRGGTKGLIVAGCLPERMGGSLLEEMPEIDHVVGVFGREEITRVADRLIGGAREQREVFRPAPIRALDDRSRLRITPSHFAYLKISEGCDRTCTFCAIPKMRGKHATKPMDLVIAEAQELAADGVRELNIVAQDTTYYGLDLYGEVRLTQLLKELEQVDGIDWIRLMYLYPINFTDQLIDTIAASNKIIPYLDMPLQHINDTMLKRMQRRVNKADSVALVKKLRERIPNVVMRTTFVVGFPGETDAQFRELKDFVSDIKFERMGVFTYSLEPDTPAVKLPDHLPEKVKQQRMGELMSTQQQIAFDFSDSLVGYELDVLIDAHVEDDTWLGRTYADAPEIDGNIYVTGTDINVGDMVPVEITARHDYDLVGIASELETA
ncbi:Ribosomal protein S12 methylthiotransferase RimO [Symmachiella macrocystis]|uniref:Ribosomal protein uS12 methylthiotransferase RimO n=1 Tax=Symmachiella macrocystis TaxID=2527985 RepID=A0A5C6BAH8_9PLAN|nr:30S ribosomal protein S12 methylthiotransferase RimO [Symmachiella macrocystis]TWU09275.1 Ribosomal protein S12 methylthiotransferase RimO [Symmachiella macrocystis]